MASQICEVLATVGDLDKNWLGIPSAAFLLSSLSFLFPVPSGGQQGKQHWWPPLPLWSWGQASTRQRSLLDLDVALHSCAQLEEPPPSQTFTTATTCEPKKGLRASLETSIHPSFIDTAAGSKSNKENAKFCTQIIFYTKVCRLNVSLLSFWESV